MCLNVNLKEKVLCVLQKHQIVYRYIYIIYITTIILFKNVHSLIQAYNL